MPARTVELLALGQSVWLDFIRRGFLLAGDFDRLVRDQGVVGVTSNPTIFQQAIAEGEDYDAAIQDGITQGLEGPALFESLAVADIQNACDRLRAAYERTDGRDGRVSIEVSPRLAADTAATLEEARRLHRSVSRPNVMVKVPATPEGLPAITRLTAEGLSINVTLIFTLARYQQVMDAWLAGLEERARQNQPLDGIRSVASFFVSRVDTKVDKAIEDRIASLPAAAAERRELESLRGKAAIANARLAYQRFKEVCRSQRFQSLETKGAHKQRPLWASTSTKNPAYRDILYAEELIGPDTVDTMPLKTIEAFNDHGRVAATIENDLDGARALFQRLPQLGIPLDTLIAQLEDEGVVAFRKSYDTLIDALESKRREMVASRGGGS